MAAGSRANHMKDATLARIRKNRIVPVVVITDKFVTLNREETAEPNAKNVARYRISHGGVAFAIPMSRPATNFSLCELYPTRFNQPATNNHQPKRIALWPH